MLRISRVAGPPPLLVLKMKDCAEKWRPFSCVHEVWKGCRGPQTWCVCVCVCLCVTGWEAMNNDRPVFLPCAQLAMNCNYGVFRTEHLGIFSLNHVRSRQLAVLIFRCWCSTTWTEVSLSWSLCTFQAVAGEFWRASYSEAWPKGTLEAGTANKARDFADVLNMKTSLAVLLSKLHWREFILSDHHQRFDVSTDLSSSRASEPAS